jgi:hypothetical protein
VRDDSDGRWGAQYGSSDMISRRFAIQRYCPELEGSSTSSTEEEVFERRVSAVCRDNTFAWFDGRKTTESYKWRYAIGFQALQTRTSALLVLYQEDQTVLRLIQARS